jgi:uncharacterized protein YndB with AHSA1/START domain
VIDIVNELNAVDRRVDRRAGADGAEEVGVRLRRSYRAAVEDVWDALTDPDRVQRWLYPVSGDLRVGGHFQLEGNAGGEILRCEPPRLLRVTFGDATSLVEVRLSPAGDAETLLELEHTMPVAVAGGAAGSLYVGPGWDEGLLRLGLYLRGEVAGNALAEDSQPPREFSRRSVHAWAATAEAAGSATADEIAAATDTSLAQFAPEPG